MPTKSLKRGEVYFLFSILLLFFSAFASADEKPKVSVKLSSSEVWQRQQLLIKLEVKTNDPFSRLEVEEFKEKGFSIIPLDQERVETKNTTRLSIKWVVYPFISGPHKLQLPQIRYRPNHGRIQTLKIDALPLTVKALPIYVPPTMPVGKVIIENNWDNGLFITTGNLLAWGVKITGEGVAKQTMPPLSRQLVTTPSLQFLPSKSESKKQITKLGVTQQIDYTVPLKAVKSSRVDFPKIEIQYFEPISGKLEKAKLSAPLVISLNKWLYALIFFLILLLFLFSFFFLLKRLQRNIHKSKQRKYAKSLLAKASNYQQVHEAIKQLSVAHGWGDNLTLAAFTQKFSQKNGVKPKLKETIKALQELQFSPNKSTQIKNISQDLMKYF